MKRNLLFLLSLGVFLASVAVTSHLMAQGTNGTAPPANVPANPPVSSSAVQPAQRPPIPVAVVDYKYLMQIHPKLYAETNLLIQNQKAFKDQYDTEMKVLQSLNRELEGIAAGSADYTRKREELRRRTTDLEISAADFTELNQTQLLKSNYYAYQDIKKIIDGVVKEHNIIVVIDFIDIPRQLPAEQTLETMMLELTQTQTVVSYNPNFDITRTVEQALNNLFAGKYPAVNFAEVKKQMFNKTPAAGPASSPTNVATGSGQLRPQ